MSQVHTHYDNLKVAQNAPDEVIRAAYRALAQKYHPDRNPLDSDASRIMKIINHSYDILSDPQKRREHDIWIAAQGRSDTTDEEPVSTWSTETGTSNAGSVPTSHGFVKSIVRAVRKRTTRWLPGDWVVLGVGCVFVIGVWINHTLEPAEVTMPAAAKSTNNYAAARQAPQYIRPSTAPNGSRWPTTANYITGYEKLNTHGLSSVTVDNTRNTSDVFVKLVSIGGTHPITVRVFFIPASSQFTLSEVGSGTYDVRYRELDSGKLAKSESFQLDETETNEGIRYKNLTLTLYKVLNGNMKTYPIAESEF